MNKWILTIVVFSSIATGAYANEKSEKVSADNSAVNQKIVNANGLTAENQSSLPSDIDVTTKIRKILVDDKDLSTYAKNVKIIVLKKGITLKGPVNTLAERDRIVNVAYGVAPQMKIYNQITIVK